MSVPQMSAPQANTHPAYPNIFGSIPALVTPMLSNGEIDWECYKALIEWHIAEGTNGICVVGTTGESPTVNVVEHCKLIEVAVKTAAGRIPIIAGAGGNSTAEAIELSLHAKAVGAAAALQVVPYYNKPSQEGLYQHFKAIAQASQMPIILYNVPGRTVADMSNETILRLADVPWIMGIKDATGDLARGTALIKSAPAHFVILSGDDATAPAYILLGARGNISVTANVLPKAMSELCAAATAGNAVETRRINDFVMPMNQTLFLEANPIPVKWAMQRMGKMQAGIRLPLVALSTEFQPKVLKAMQACGLVS